MIGLTAEQTTIGVARQLWLSRQLAEVLAGWDAQGHHPGVRVWAATAHRRLDEHIEVWTTQLPESVLLEPQRNSPPDPGDEALLGAARAAADPGPFTDAARSLLAAAVAALDDLVADAGPVGDRALVRAVMIVRRDLVALIESLPDG